MSDETLNYTIIGINSISALIALILFECAAREGDSDFAKNSMLAVFVFGIFGFILIPIILIFAFAGIIMFIGNFIVESLIELIKKK